MADGLISIAEAARRIGRSESQTRRLAREGLIPAERIGRDWLVREEGLAAPERKRGWPAGKPRNPR